MSLSKQHAHPHSLPVSASSHSHRSPLACHPLSLQSFSFCTWPMAVWSSLLHMNNNIWLFRQKPSDSAVSTVFITSFFSPFSFFPSPASLHHSNSFPSFLWTFSLLILQVTVHVLYFLTIILHSFLSLPLPWVCAFFYDAERLTLPTAMLACCCVGGTTEGWGGVCHIPGTGRAQWSQSCCQDTKLKLEQSAHRDSPVCFHPRIHLTSNWIYLDHRGLFIFLL